MWAYILENMTETQYRNNQPVFCLVNEFEIDDEHVFIDRDDRSERIELNELIDKLSSGERLIVRSVTDFADTLVELTEVFQQLNDKGVILYSCEEPFFCGEDYLENLSGYIRFYLSFQKKKQKQAYQKAVSAGKVGRPSKDKAIDQALDLYRRGLKVTQIETLTGISKSTLYRHLDRNRQ